MAEDAWMPKMSILAKIFHILLFCPCHQSCGLVTTSCSVRVRTVVKANETLPAVGKERQQHDEISQDNHSFGPRYWACGRRVVNRLFMVPMSCNSRVLSTNSVRVLGRTMCLDRTTFIESLASCLCLNIRSSPSPLKRWLLNYLTSCFRCMGWIQTHQ